MSLLLQLTELGNPRLSFILRTETAKALSVFAFSSSLFFKWAASSSNSCAFFFDLLLLLTYFKKLFFFFVNVKYHLLVLTLAFGLLYFLPANANCSSVIFLCGLTLLREILTSSAWVPRRVPSKAKLIFWPPPPPPVTWLMTQWDCLLLCF